MSLILTQTQAEAVYDAMCALNNVGGRLKTVLADTRRVIEYPGGSIIVSELLRGGWEPCERYATQADFAAAYNVKA